MSYIIHTDNLYDNKGNIFGYVGRDLTTNKTRYFLITPHFLEEITDFTSIDVKLDKKLQSAGFFREANFWNLPSEYQEIIAMVKEMHAKFNTSLGYPNNLLENNCENLKAHFYINHHMTLLKQKAMYNPLTNELLLAYDFHNNSKEELLKFKSILLYIMGIIKTSQCVFDKYKEEVKVQSGFRYDIYKVSPYTLLNGDCFLLKEYIVERTQKDADILNDLINDYECGLIDPKYEMIYDKEIMTLIKQITIGSLMLSRYNGSIDTYYKKMETVINDHALAQELLYSTQDKTNNEHLKLTLEKYRASLK